MKYLRVGDFSIYFALLKEDRFPLLVVGVAITFLIETDILFLSI